MSCFILLQRGKLQRKPVIGKILFLALSRVEMCSVPSHLTSAEYEERKKKVESIEKQLKASPRISWRPSENIVRRGQKSLTKEEHELWSFGTLETQLW